MAPKIAQAPNQASPDSIPFPGIPTHIQSQWKSRIKTYLPKLNQSKTITDLYQDLDRLRIPGVGTGTIIRTAEWICRYNDNIDKESNCACYLLNNVVNNLADMGLKGNEICRRTLCENVPDMAGKDIFQIISYVNKALKY